MKRQGENSSNQSSGKKSDGNVSTDLRSKIGAKLQTLLNGITPEPRQFPRNRRQLYKDLFGENEYTPIIIDTPTIVIKSEPEVEECSNVASSFNSQNFLLSAKNRLTQLLNKPDGVNKCSSKDNEKENALSRNKHASTSSLKPNCSNSQSHQAQSLSNSLSKKRKLSSGRDDSSESTTNQVRLKKISNVVEDVRNPNDTIESSHTLPNKPLNRKNSSDSILSVNEDNAKDDIIIGEPGTFLPSDTVECVIEEDSSTVNQLNTKYATASLSSNKKNNVLNTSKSFETSSSLEPVLLDGPNSASIILPIGASLLRETANRFLGHTDDSELVDDPGTNQPVIDVERQSGFRDNDHSLNSRSVEPEVVLLCIKKPTHEVITLEDNDDSDDVIEEVFKCPQCNKAFRAKSLLNFHIRMHGSDSLSSPSSSQSCS